MCLCVFIHFGCLFFSICLWWTSLNLPTRNLCCLNNRETGTLKQIVGLDWSLRNKLGKPLPGGIWPQTLHRITVWPAERQQMSGDGHTPSWKTTGVFATEHLRLERVQKTSQHISVTVNVSNYYTVWPRMPPVLFWLFGEFWTSLCYLTHYKNYISNVNLKYCSKVYIKLIPPSEEVHIVSIS